MGIEIRQATPDDAPAACALLRRSIEHGCVADHAQRPEGEDCGGDDVIVRPSRQESRQRRAGG